MAMFCIAWLGCSSDFFCGLWELLGKFRGKGWSNSHLSRLCFGIFFSQKVAVILCVLFFFNGS